MRLSIVIMGLLTALAHPALAQIALPPARPVISIVTVLSDGLSEPSSAASQILSEISVTLDKESGVRVLPVNGYGGPTNARDLLQLRGADLAVINNDVLAYLDLAKALPEARRKVRLVAPLFNQGVFLFARQPIKSIGDLRGQKIGVAASRPSRGITARTVFGLLKLDAKIVEIKDSELANKASGDLNAVLVFERDLGSLQAWGVTPASHHLLPIPVTSLLTPVYLPKKLGKNAIAGFSVAGVPETIQVTAVLAAFDWNPKQARYPEVTKFVEKFFALLPRIRERYPHSPFSRTDVRVKVPGWTHFEPAAALAAAAPPVTIKEDSTSLAAQAVESPPSGDVLKVLAVARPPLTNSQDKDGGVALKILAGALRAAGLPVSIQWAGSERALLDGIVTKKTADAGFFWQTPHCDAPSNQSANEAELCDRAVLSEPLMQAVISVFTRLDMSLEPGGPDAGQTRTICVPENQPVPQQAVAEIPWIKGASVKILRPKSLIDCLAAVERHEADALIAIEPEARFVIERLKLSQSFQISQRAAVTTGLHAVVAKDNPRQAEIIQGINDALLKFRAGVGYAAVMASHFADLTGSQVKQP